MDKEHPQTLAKLDGCELVCEVPAGSNLHWYNDTLIVTHPDYPPRYVDFLNKRLVEIKLKPMEIDLGT